MKIQRVQRPGALRLYCFPHAGGSPGEYAFWGDEVTDLDVAAIELPGRGRQFAAPALTSMTAMRDAVLDGVAFEPPFALFGHSLGAVLAFEVARVLEARGTGPCWLVASASRAPHLPSRLAPLTHLDDASLVRALGDTDPALRDLLEDPDLIELVAPALRGDLTAAETYRYSDGPPLACGLHVLGGTDDDLAADELDAWRRHTRGAWSRTMLAGDHFFTRSRRADVLAWLSQLGAPSGDPRRKEVPILAALRTGSDRSGSGPLMTLSSAAARSRAGFLGQLFQGHLRWDLLASFPRQAAGERAAGDAVIDEARAFLREHVDPAEVEATGALPADYVDGLRAHRLLHLQLDPALGGRGLSPFNVMRVIQAAMAWCLPAGYVMSLQNGLGAGAVLPVIPEGPTRRYVERALAGGAVSGWADSEPAGAGNTHAATTATRLADGSFELTGEKVYIVNGSIADLLIVTATLDDDGHKQTQVFFVDTHSPGFRVRQVHHLLGLRGLPIAALSLDRVRVPAEAMLVTAEPHWRDTPLLEPISALGRMYVIVASSLAVSGACVAWADAFLARRRVDGQPLADHDAIRRLVADNAAERFAIDSVAHAALCGLTLDGTALATRWFEQVAAKNLASLGCDRVVDRTMSLLSAEGYETAPSKALRGAPAEPVERALRDARAFRIAGGVDFLIDYYAARNGMLPLYDEPDHARAPAINDPRLAPRNRAHLAQLARDVTALGDTGRALRNAAPLDVLHRRQRTLILLGQLGRELFAIAATLAHAAALGDPTSQALADVYCTTAHHRVRDAQHQLADEPLTGPDPALAASITACVERR